MRLLIKVEPFFLEELFYSIKMEKHDSVPNYLLEIKDIIDPLKYIDRKMEVENLVIITLKSLTSSFEYFIETLNITLKDEIMFEQFRINIL